jgi:membrane-bound lytic murein transglycosylase MltF
VTAVTEGVARLAEAEAEVEERRAEVSSLRGELNDRDSSDQEAEKRWQQSRNLHMEQCRELEANIDRVSSDEGG